MRFGQDSTSTNQSVLQQIADGQQRLAYIESQMKANKRLMLVLVLLALIILLLNRNCHKDHKGRKRNK